MAWSAAPLTAPAACAAESISSASPAEPTPPPSARSVTLLPITHGAAPVSTPGAAVSVIDPARAASVTSPAVERTVPIRRSPANSVRFTSPLVSTSSWPLPRTSMVPRTLIRVAATPASAARRRMLPPASISPKSNVGSTS
jgi:hypothetical protein